MATFSMIRRPAFAMWTVAAALCAVSAGGARADEPAERFGPPASADDGETALLPPGWDSLRAGDAVLERLIGVTAPHVRGGTNSKPTFNRFGRLYYLGWQDAQQVDGVRRSVFNIDVSHDGQAWQRKYRFETTDAFEYPTFKEHDGTIWLTISGRNQRTILFGKLEAL